jgi:four helix bundle protein
MVKTYKELVVWQKAMELVTEVYRITSTFPKNEIYGLTSQLRRSAVSIPSNIAEGQARMTRGEFLQFLGHARGSLMEVETQILVAANLKYISSTELQLILEKIEAIGRLLNGLINSLRVPNRNESVTSHEPRATNHSSNHQPLATSHSSFRGASR